jgi:putative ABC transport system substrate-binding protein
LNLARRRTLLLAATGLLAASLARAQKPGRSYKVGALLSGGPGMERYRTALRERLASHGFVEGRNLLIDARGAAGAFHEDRESVRAMVAAKADAIFTCSSRATEAALAATKSVPIVFTWVGDAVGAGIVTSYAKPGGNVTGVTTRFEELTHKRLELAHELLPKAKRIAVVGLEGKGALGEAFAAAAPALRKAAANLGVELVEMVTYWRGGWDARLDEAMKAGAEALVPFAWFADSPVTGDLVVEFANRHRIPAVFADSDTVERGGLISWGTNPVDDVRRAADLLARVLKGAKPADLPVDQASRFEMVLNLRTAKAIGLTIPQTVLLRADRVIE